MDIEKYRYLVYTDNPDQIYTPNESSVTGVKGNEEQDYRTGNVNITCADIGAAEDTHVHSASDITSGILSTANGGTGSANFLKNDVQGKINTTTNLSVSTSTWKKGGSFTIDPGIYLAIIHTEWATNTTGMRMHVLSTSDPDSSSFAAPTNSTATCSQSASGSTSVTMRMTSVAFITASAATTYYLGLYQTSGSALNCTARRVAIIQLS